MEPPRTHAVVLAGGEGRRLRPFTWVIPKPLVPVEDMPILEILLRQLARDGFDRVTLAVGYLAALIRAYCGDGSQWGLTVDYLAEETPLGTAGFLGNLSAGDADRILVVNGDTLTDLDFAEFSRSHDPGDAASICAYPRSVEIDFGILHFDDEKRLVRYEEKPVLSHHVSMGVNVLSRWAVDRYVRPGERLDMPELLCRMTDDDATVRVVSPDIFWLDLGRPEDLERANEVFRVERARFLP
ncbi:MAG TPA: sugar phosphate nucleotidyltransferase [Acidimicrobiales bacterium]|nr:sugar phosphate nucleotidyltransferase [Acidimicrobiales bacterium]